MLVPGATVAAEAQKSAADLVQGIHIVRPGETLERLATVYLGSASEWRRLHRLNPDIEDPDLIEPGQRIIVVIRRDLVPAALVDRLSRQVDEQAAPIPWTEAKIGDLLLERDGLRTYRRSSAGMSFTDGTRLTVTEDSLVFLRRAGRTLTGVESKAVEIVEGQADLAARFGPAPRRPEVELILGATRSTARPDAAGRRRHGLATRPAPRPPLQLLLCRSDGDPPGHRGHGPSRDGRRGGGHYRRTSRTGR
jgi:LysM repeat protein